MPRFDVRVKFFSALDFRIMGFHVHYLPNPRPAGPSAVATTLLRWISDLALRRNVPGGILLCLGPAPNGCVSDFWGVHVPSTPDVLRLGSDGDIECRVPL